MPLPRRLGGVLIEWSSHFFILAASATVADALAQLKARPLPFVLVSRLPNFMYVYRTQELRQALRGAHPGVPIETVLALHEFTASQAVTVASARKATVRPSQPASLTAPRFYVVEPKTRAPVRVGLPGPASHGAVDLDRAIRVNLGDAPVSAPPPPYRGAWRRIPLDLPGGTVPFEQKAATAKGGRRKTSARPPTDARRTKNGGSRRARPITKAVKKNGGARRRTKKARRPSTPAYPSPRKAKAAPRRPARGARRARARRGPAPAARAVVSTGFAAVTAFARPLSASTPLRAGERYYFWLQIGERASGAIDDVAVEAPREPVGTRLRVVLFAFPGGFRIASGADQGGLEVTDESGAARVTSTPSADLVRAARLASKRGERDLHDLLEHRLFFQVTAPRTSGIARLRCNIYRGQTLLQSRLVEARVMQRVRRTPKALRAVLDYTISHTFDAERLSKLPHYTLSLMANQAGGTHAFWLVGTNWKRQAFFTEASITSMLERARGALRKVAWDSTKPWDGNAPYRYASGHNDGFVTDLIALATSGYKLYARIINRFAGPQPKYKELATAMQAPGFVQIAISDASYLLPAALIYDRPLDTALDDAAYTVCGDFLATLDQKQLDLSTHRCFLGNCRFAGDKSVVCPSGFWGFRQNLGLPLSVPDAPEPPTELAYKGALGLSGALSTDLKDTEDHLTELRKLGSGWEFASTREGVFKLLRKGAPQLVYFYCHGGVTGDQAYLQVGDLKKEYAITPDQLMSEDILWERSRPLVFLNGCETVAVEPPLLLDLASAFVSSRAGGVIGTETTVFEPLATVFAQACLREFLVNGRPIGEAVRLARLVLLHTGNPMGLVYTVFMLPSVKLVAQN